MRSRAHVELSPVVHDAAPISAAISHGPSDLAQRPPLLLGDEDRSRSSSLERRRPRHAWLDFAAARPSAMKRVPPLGVHNACESPSPATALRARSRARSPSPAPCPISSQLVLFELREIVAHGDLTHSTTTTRIEFVLPATPTGAPNMATMRSPGDTEPLPSKKALARWTISSASRMSSKRYGTTPQSKASRRRVPLTRGKSHHRDDRRCLEAKRAVSRSR